MNHSDYAKLIRSLGHISKNTDHIRTCFSMSFAITDDGTMVATSTPEQFKTAFKVNRAKLWMETVKADTELCRYLDGLTDGWFELNQGRADKGLGPTADERELYGAMVSFLSATSVPVDGWGVLYEKTRNLCNTWTAHTLSWFPDLADLSARAGDEGETIQVSADDAEVKCDSKTKRKETLARKKAEKIETFKRDFFNHQAVRVELDKGDDSRIELKDQQIIWKSYKIDLCSWLVACKIIPRKFAPDENPEYQWGCADNVFTWYDDGKLISSHCLGETWKKR